MKKKQSSQKLTKLTKLTKLSKLEIHKMFTDFLMEQDIPKKLVLRDQLLELKSKDLNSYDKVIVKEEFNIALGYSKAAEDPASNSVHCEIFLKANGEVELTPVSHFGNYINMYKSGGHNPKVLKKSEKAILNLSQLFELQNLRDGIVN